MALVFVVITATAMVTGGATAAARSQTGPGVDGEEIRPGERLSGLIGAEHAEFEGAIVERTFDITLARADTDAERA